MTETNEKAVSHGEYSEGISIETSKVIQGMGLVFSGAMTMLEAIHPKISIDPAELMCLMTGDREGLAKLAEMKKATAAEKDKEEAHEPQNADVGSNDSSASVPDSSVGGDPEKPVTETRESADKPAEVEAPKEADAPKKAEAPKAAEARKKKAPVTVTQDDITKIIVQKIKANRSNNEKIGQLLKNYGAARVSDLPASKYEAFITELASI